MKKIHLLAAMAVAAATFTACGNSTPKAQLKTDVDSMSYAIGLVQSQYVRQAIQQGQVIDTTYMSEFIKGINEGVNAGDNKKKAAYIMGLQIGQQISTQLVKDVGTMLEGEEAVREGLIDEVGGISDAFHKLHELINDKKKCDDMLSK